MKAFIIRVKQNQLSCDIARECVSRAKSFGLDVEYFDGVYGNEGNEVFEKYGVKKFKRFVKRDSPGRLGCAASHYLLWKKCIELNETVLILEQDGYQIRPIPKDIDSNFDEVMKLDSCWPFDDTYEKCVREDHPTEKYKEYSWPQESIKDALKKAHKFPFGYPYFRGAWSYMIKPKGAHKVIKMFEQEGWVPADKVFSSQRMSLKTTTETIFRLHPFYKKENINYNSLTANLEYADKVELRQGWIWPKDDVRCWRCFQKHTDLPDRIMKYVTKKSVCVQAGGNVGVYVKKFAENFETVHTFEPEPLNFYCLHHNLASFYNVFKHQGFIGNINEQPKGIERFDTQKDPNTGKFRIGREPGHIIVHSIDSLDLDACDLIQLDIEGYEYQALLGAMETIKKFKPVICLEWFENQQQLSEIMEQFNYQQVADFKSDRVFVSN